MIRSKLSLQLLAVPSSEQIVGWIDFLHSSAKTTYFVFVKIAVFLSSPSCECLSYRTELLTPNLSIRTSHAMEAIVERLRALNLVIT